MKDNNQLDDFFKKKLDEDGSDGQWDVPSGRVWEDFQQNRGVVVPFWNGEKVAILGMASLLLLSLGYCFYLKKQVTQLKDEVTAIEQSFAIQKQSCESLAVENALENAKSLEKEKAQSKQLLAQENTIQRLQNVLSQFHLSSSSDIDFYKKRLQKQENLIKTLENTTPLFENEPIDKSLIEHKKVEKISQHILKETINQENLHTEIDLSKVIMSKNIQALPTPNATKSLNIQHPKHFKKSTKFELALDFRISNYKVPVAYDFSNISSFKNGNTIQNFNQPNFGVRLGYAIKPNVYLQMGLRHTNFETEEATIQGMIYSNARTYSTFDGHLYNNFKLNATTPFQTTQREITFSIPENLQPNDWMFANLDYRQSFELTQIPLGISYFKGEGRWQMTFLGGLTWNNIQMINSDFEIILQSNNQIVSIHNISEATSTYANNQYLGAYLGFGANYQMYNNWYFRTSFLMEDNFLNIRAGRWSRRYLSDNGWNVSLNYRF